MTANLFKEASAASRCLSDDLRGILEEIDPTVSESLLARISSSPHPAPLLVFTGQYGSGKSTLIKALTNGQAAVVIGSGVTTDRVEEFDWEGDVRLVDTPGVHAGWPGHDQLAEEALQSADLVLFAVTVELFDDVLTAHLREVLGRLGKSQQTLVVLTKAGTMDAPQDVWQRAIADALGDYPQVPWAPCDAQYYLDGLEIAVSDPFAAREYIDASGIVELTELMNRFAIQTGELGRLSQPLQTILAISLEASAVLAEDPAERAALTVLARQRSALSRKRAHLDILLDAHAAQFRSDSVRAAERFADSVEQDEGPDLTEAEHPEHLAALNADLGASLERFEAAVRHAFEVQFDDLASEVLEIESSPYGRLSVELGEPQPIGFDSRAFPTRPVGTVVPPPPPWAEDLSKYLKKFHDVWGAGSGVKRSVGSSGHRVVLEVGHAFGKKFKPWEAVRTANTIGRAVKVGNVVISVALEAYGIVAEERAAVQAEQSRVARRRSITREILSQVDDLSSGALKTIWDALDDVFRPEFHRIDGMTAEIHGGQSTRADLQSRLGQVQRRAHEVLTSLAVDAMQNGPQ